MKKSVIFLIVSITLLLTINATEFFCNEPIAQIDGDKAYPFEKVELLKDSSNNFIVEKYHSDNELSHPALLELTNGNSIISSGNFFLHYSKGWNKKSDKRPILLVHGAGDNAYRAFAHPYKYYFAPGEKIDHPGLALILSEMGYQVFSLSFVHSHGDNFMQSEHIANAISRIKKVLDQENNSDFKVDIIAHSKGGVATRMYLSDIREEYSNYKWLTAFRKDVKRFYSIATPLNGVDAQYRFYGLNLTVLQEEMASPLGADKMLYYGFWQNLSDNNAMFPGQCQILNDLVNDSETPIPFSNLSSTPDMNYTRDVLYHGGISSLVISKGIKSAMDKGKNLIKKLNRKGMDPSVELAVMAGTDNQIDDNVELWSNILPFANKIEQSDMLLFVKSATYIDGICRRGALHIGTKVIPYNHMNIAFNPGAVKHLVELMEK